MIISIDSPIYGKHWSNESAVPTSKKIINRIIINDKYFFNKAPIIAAKNDTTKKNITIKKTPPYENRIIKTKMPNLKGKTFKEAILLARENGIMLEPNTLKGKVIWQSLRPGVKTKKNQICKIKLSI